jgi:hypothetical protein
MTITITTADLDALDSVYRRAEDDWNTYYSSGYGPLDFPTAAEWRAHIRRSNAALRRVRQLLTRASASSAERITSAKKGTV